MHVCICTRRAPPRRLFYRPHRASGSRDRSESNQTKPSFKLYYPKPRGLTHSLPRARRFTQSLPARRFPRIAPRVTQAPPKTQRSHASGLGSRDRTQGSRVVLHVRLHEALDEVVPALGYAYVEWAPIKEMHMLTARTCGRTPRDSAPARAPPPQRRPPAHAHNADPAGRCRPGGGGGGGGGGGQARTSNASGSSCFAL